MRVIKLDKKIQFVIVEKKPKYKNIVNTSVASFIRCMPYYRVKYHRKLPLGISQ